MSILASATPSMLLGTGLAMDGSFRPYNTIATHVLLDGSVHTDTAAQGVTRGSIIYANSTPKWDELVKGSTGQFLQSGASDVSWVSMSGDATLSGGAITIANNAVTDAKIRDSAAVSVIGRSAATGGDPADIAATKAGQALQQIGTTLSFGISQCLDGMFACRMQRDSTTQVSLQYYNGRYIDVNGEMVDVSSSGYALLTSDNLLSSTGTDSGGAMGTSTLYYVYVSNSQASFAPGDLRASATGPSAYRGAKYLGTSGNAAHWRFVGWVRTNGSTNFVDTSLDRLVINYHNRLRLPLLANPAYADNNAVSFYTTASKTFVAANGGTGATLSYIANGEDAVFLNLSGTSSNSGAAGVANDMGISTPDSTTTAHASSRQWSPGAVYALSHCCAYADTPAVGYHAQSLLIAVSSNTGTFYADLQRNGSASDPRSCKIDGLVMG